MRLWNWSDKNTTNKFAGGGRLFLIETSPDITEIDIYDITGRLVEKITNNKTCWLAPASGIYYLRNSKKGIGKKIVVY